MKSRHDMRQARVMMDASSRPQAALRGEGGLTPAESSVAQARWLLVPIFSLYGGIMLAGMFLS
jgi:hypothetical protein